LWLETDAEELATVLATVVGVVGAAESDSERNTLVCSDARDPMSRLDDLRSRKDELDASKENDPMV
jgi:hypothetical protein